MNADEAKLDFLQLLDKLQEGEKPLFLKWLHGFVENEHEADTCDHDGSSTCLSTQEKQAERKADILLSCIKGSLKEKIPFDGVMGSEAIHFPTVGEDVNLNEENCINVDGFLYDEDDVELLVESGKIANNFCKDCNSRNVEAMTFISHSASKDRLRHIFKDCLPSLDGKVVLDIGSRFGVVLYTAYVYTKAAKIIGVELNHELCDIQRHIIEKYKLTDRLLLHEADVIDTPDAVKQADVIVLMNVFEWFLNFEDQVKVWRFLHATIKSGTWVVASPPIDVSLTLVDSDIDVNRWLEEVDLRKTTADTFLEETEFKVYKVL